MMIWKKLKNQKISIMYSINDSGYPFYILNLINKIISNVELHKINIKTSIERAVPSSYYFLHLGVQIVYDGDIDKLEIDNNFNNKYSLHSSSSRIRSGNRLEFDWYDDSDLKFIKTEIRLSLKQIGGNNAKNQVEDFIDLLRCYLRGNRSIFNKINIEHLSNDIEYCDGCDSIIDVNFKYYDYDDLESVQRFNQCARCINKNKLK